jgi:histidinol dehydrogenase
MKIIECKEFDSYWKNQTIQENDEETEAVVKEIINAVRTEGDAAIRFYASKFDKSSPQQLEVPIHEAKSAFDELRTDNPALIEALELAANNINRFSLKQKEQFANFEFEIQSGLLTGQRVIPVERAAVYVPGGRFPLFSSVLMGLIPAFSAGVEEVILTSPPEEDGLPNRVILAAAWTALQQSYQSNNRLRIFSTGGAQAIAALAYGTESIPRADIIAGPGNKYVAAAKRLVYGQAGIDFVAGPSDVLIIAQPAKEDNFQAADITAADMIAQAEHDPDARARALVPNIEFANLIKDAVKKRLEKLSTAEIARASLESGSIIIVYKNMIEAVRVANIIAPEHLELHVENDDDWIPHLKNYGSLFIGSLSAEVLGDYSAGINHTLPTSASARFTGGLSVRQFLKTVTTLRCTKGDGFEKARKAAEILALAEGLEGHAQSAALRK